MSSLCPCGSQHTYSNCCGPYIESKKTPATPEALMRSRYTAYTQAHIAYIEKTMRGKAAINYDPNQAYLWAKGALWLGLTVVATSMDPQNPERGFVEFIARYESNQQKHHIHEISEFNYIQGHWYYVDGLAPSLTKIGRNDPCACGSGKKYKKCCGK